MPPWDAMNAVTAVFQKYPICKQVGLIWNIGGIWQQPAGCYVQRLCIGCANSF